MAWDCGVDRKCCSYIYCSALYIRSAWNLGKPVGRMAACCSLYRGDPVRKGGCARHISAENAPGCQFHRCCNDVDRRDASGNGVALCDRCLFSGTVFWCAERNAGSVYGHTAGDVGSGRCGHTGNL